MRTYPFWYVWDVFGCDGVWSSRRWSKGEGIHICLLVTCVVWLVQSRVKVIQPTPYHQYMRDVGSKYIIFYVKSQYNHKKPTTHAHNQHRKCPILYSNFFYWVYWAPKSALAFLKLGRTQKKKRCVADTYVVDIFTNNLYSARNWKR